jgi:hypothetical protein
MATSLGTACEDQVDWTREIMRYSWRYLRTLSTSRGALVEPSPFQHSSNLPEVCLSLLYSISGPRSYSSTNRLQALDRILDALLQAPILDTQHVDRALVVELVHAFLGVIAAGRLLRRQTLLVLRVVLADNLRNLLVGEVARGDEEALVGRSLALFDGRDVAGREVAYVDPEVGAGGGDFVFGFAEHDVADALVGGVEAVERVQVVHDGTQDEGGTHGGDGEVGLLLLDEFPSGALGEGLAGAVAVGRVLDGLLGGERVPVAFGVGVVGPVPFERVDDAGEGGGDYDALDRGGGFCDGFEDAGCADYGWVEEFLFALLVMSLGWKREMIVKLPSAHQSR